MRARAAARSWLRELDGVEEDWDATDVLWRCIEVWLNAETVNCEEFLSLFRAHHRLSMDEASASAVGRTWEPLRNAFE
jgi:hypothetical protein